MVDGHFKKLEKRIKSTSIRSAYGIMKSPLDHKWVILLSVSSFEMFGNNGNSVILVSKDACKTFTSIKLPFKLRNNQPLLFHPKKKNWIIGMEEKRTVSYNGNVFLYGQAFISKDFGKTWKVMMKGFVASSVKWGTAEGKEGDEIYLTSHSKHSLNSLSNPVYSFLNSVSSPRLTLWRSSDGGTKFEKIIEHCLDFGVEGKFVFAFIVFNVSKHDHRKIMHVSKDSGANFQAVNIPEITTDRFYSVMEMHKGMIFLHVDESTDNGKGTLFISDADGLRYTKSLDDHFYTNSGYTDFTRIESMHGVYITQVLQQNRMLKSVITFDRGLSWKPLYVDKKKYCNESDDCTLHFHKSYSNVKHHSDIQGPLSSKSAPGIIFIHGQAGDALTGTAEVWLSTNGGYNWTKIANNPHHYAIGDNGNLLVIVPRVNNTGNMLKYSIDQGRCWHNYKFHDINQEMVIRGLVTEPHAKERTFSLWGYFKNVFVNQQEWNVITINFHGMFSKQCDRSDLDVWSPHILYGKNGCFLGEKLYYGKPKLTADCYLGKDFQPLLRTSKCTCHTDDLECDYGYERQSDGTCKENKSIKPIEVCEKGEKMSVRFSKGYRRLPGDVCDAKDAVDDVVILIDEQVKCVPLEKEIRAFGVVKEEEKLFTKEKQETKKKQEMKSETTESDSYQVKKTNRTVNGGHTFFTLIGILLLIGVLLGIGWFGINYIRNRKYAKPTYSMSDLIGHENEDDDEHIYDHRPKTQRQFKDESDVEDDVMLQL